ncbi:Beta-phosphoglucomutase [hydrothermal vent metagenome]|uniref:Beta-phosphoglucomutase n=1 Tax=hydrothermal vent metagenome TaxID=652676 RepID=A0A3B0U4F5_9ZZZZ
MRFSVIFDMDGVIVDNGHYHQLAWMAFCNSHKIPFSENEFKSRFFGRTNEQILPALFKKNLPPDEIDKLGEEKEAAYRKIYKPRMTPVKGLIPFLAGLKKGGYPVAIATSAPKSNIDFVLKGIKIQHFIDCVVDDKMVARGKPDPEIYLKTASLLNTAPYNCVVFEDSLSGTKSAFDAGTKVVGLTTTMPENEHKYVHHVIRDFSEISVELLSEIFFQ